MYLQNGKPVMNEYNAKVWILLFVIILVFLIMISALALCLFKVIYRHLEDEFEERLNEQKNPMMPLSTGIRPISTFLPEPLNSKLDAVYENRRGTGFNLRHPDRHFMNKSFVETKKVSFPNQ